MMKKILFTLLSVMTLCGAIAQEAKIQSKDGKYSVTAHGNINMRVSYDFDGVIDGHPDFITSLIPVPGDATSQQRFNMDATTSRVEVKGLVKTADLGDVELCLNMDMRGGEAGISYTPRVRLAYITAKGFLVGRNFTTFCDMGAASPNIDFEGPSVCPYIYTAQIRYTRALDEHFTVGGALEYHGYQSTTLNDDYESLDPRLPLIPAFIEYKWASKQGSHVRVTGLYKNISIYDVAKDDDMTLNGWGAQLSGSLSVGGRLKFLYSGTCGEGITDFMQDTYGSGLDVTVSGNANNPEPRMSSQAGWQGTAMVNVSKRVLMSAGYSEVTIGGDASNYLPTDYRKAKYAFGNIFYSLTPRVQLAAEYLWGSRKNVNLQYNTANRINTMIQYNF